LTGNPAVDRIIEQLCHEGCREVLANIQALDGGDDLDGRVKHLSAAERALLCAELRAIMRMYGNSCHL